jgi:hypothetical protein
MTAPGRNRGTCTGTGGLHFVTGSLPGAGEGTSCSPYAYRHGDGRGGHRGALHLDGAPGAARGGPLEPRLLRLVVLMATVGQLIKQMVTSDAAPAGAAAGRRAGFP